MARMPLYKAAETEMISRIERGDWEIGRRLPNEFELADEFGVSQGTMRRALMSLEAMGFLSRKPGRGTLVAANAPLPEANPSPLLPQILGADGEPLDLIPFRARATTRGATPAEARRLGSTRLATLERTFKIEGQRAAIDRVALPENLVPALAEDAPALLSDLLDAHGLSAARITASATAEMTDMSQSVALSVDRHTALLCVSLTAFDAAGHVIATQLLKIASHGVQLTFS